MPVPVIDIAAPGDGGAALLAAAEQAFSGCYEWVAFTSANAVDAFMALVPDVRALAGTRLAVVGPATAGALARHRVVPDLVPGDHRAEGLLAALPPPSLRWHRSHGQARNCASVLLPQSAGARPTLRDGLGSAGWRVDAVEAYRTVRVQQPPEVLSFAAKADAVCFASPSALDSYLDQAHAAGVGIPPVVACIGPTTSAAAARRGLVVSAQAAEHNPKGLVSALVDVLGTS